MRIKSCSRQSRNYSAGPINPQPALKEHTGASVDELTEDELSTAMQELGIQSMELDENDKAIITKESDSF